jgi:hypothetical protein
MTAEQCRRFYAPGMTEGKGAEEFCGISAWSLFQYLILPNYIPTRSWPLFRAEGIP